MIKKVLAWILVITSLGALLLHFSGKWTEVFWGIKPTSGISVSSVPSDAAVFLNDQEVGRTPYEDKNLEAKDYTVKIEKDSDAWQGKVTLRNGTTAVITRDLAPDQASSAGEILTLDKGKGLTLVSNPTEADVEIDGKSSGKTPVNVEAAPGDHTVVFKHTNYSNRSIRANLPDHYNLTIVADLALAEADLTNITTPTVTATPEVMVKQTVSPNPGFLRVRDKPSLNGKEIARANPGDLLILLEELGGWDRVRLSDGAEGFVSSSYVDKKTP